MGGLVFSLLAIEEKTPKPHYRKGAFWHGLVFCGILLAMVLGGHYYSPELAFFPSIGEGWEGVYQVFIYCFVPFLLGFYIGYDTRQNSVLFFICLVALSFFGQILLYWQWWDLLWWSGTLTQQATGKMVYSPHSLPAELFYILAGGGAFLALYFPILSRYYWKKRWKNEQEKAGPLDALYPGQMKIVQAFAEYHFQPISTKQLEQGAMGRRFSEFMSSFSWVNQLGLSLAIELIQILPAVILLRPRFFTSLDAEQKNRFFYRMEHFPHPALFNLSLILKTTLSLLYYEDQEFFDQNFGDQVAPQEN